MKPLPKGRWLCALLLAAGAASPAPAAWNDVFQVCCNSCGSRPATSSYYAPVPVVAAASPCTSCAPPCQTCTTQYVQRSYYQPVTCYKTQTYYEPVTTYKTSYYMEPVTTLHYSCFFDPCTCSYKQVATPCTSYRMRSQTCAATSYLQRTCQVPVTSYQLSYYFEPVTTCSAPPPCPCPAPCPCPSPCASPCSNASPVAPAAPAPQPPAGVQEQTTPSTQPSLQPPAGVQEQRIPPPANGNSYYPAPSTKEPPTAPGASYRPMPAATPPPPTVKLERIVSLPAGPGTVRGQLVQADNAPRGGAKLTFASTSGQQSVTADHSGQFQVSLASGRYDVYVDGSDGKAVYLNQIDVRGEQNRPIILVSR